MLVVSNVTKIFNARKKNKCVALKNISFSLPNKGLAFIVGKSGSGKTTLLSLIGGLDKFNEGEINVDGLNLSNLKGTKFDYYRNEKIGFIFQDFELFDELTVYENIKLALDFNDNNDYTKIDVALKNVNLNGYQNRKIKELSGGEKQRVAIARTLVKNPSIILADEPTGNLDHINSKAVLEILKEISRTKLVIIVSHNLYDAHKYSDYILELQDGELIGTYIRNLENKKSAEVKDGILRIPLHKELIAFEKYKLIKDINLGIKDIIQDDADFKAVKLKKPAKVELKSVSKRHIKLFSAFKKGLAFVKNSLKPMFIFSFVTGILFSLISVSCSMREINYDRIVNQNTDTFKNDYYYMIRDYNTKSKMNSFYDLKDDVIDKVKETGYQNDIYMSYDTGFTEVNKYYLFTSILPKNFIICKNEYLTKRFGDLEFLAKVDEPKSYGVYVTDFLIDLKNNNTQSEYRPYEELLGLKYYRNKEIYLNGIIKTDYKTKYEKFLPLIFDLELQNGKLTEKMIKKDKKLYEEYVLDSRYYLYNAFSFNENFIDDYFNCQSVLKTKNKYGYIKGCETNNGKDYSIHFENNYELNAVSPSLYYALTKKQINNNSGKFKKVDPVEVELNLLSNNVNGKKTYNKYKVTIDHLDQGKYFETTKYKLFLNYNDPNSKEIMRDVMFESNGFILDETANLTKMRENHCFDEGILINNGIVMSAENAARLSDVFNKIFLIIILGLLVCATISLIFYGVYLVKSNIRMIGISKSLGARTFDILIILAINLFLTIFLTIGIYAGLAFLSQFIIENVLQAALLDATIYQICISYQILYMNYGFYFGNMILILFLSIFSFITLFIQINKFRPIELIKKGE